MSLVPFVHLDTSLAGAAAGDDFPLAPDDVHHLSRVLRLRPGARLEVCDRAGGVATATLGERDVVLHADPTFVPGPMPRLWVAQALPKARKFDEVVRQVTELGVEAIVPVLAERSLARPDEARGQRLRARAQSVARAADEQARRAWAAQVVAPIPTDALAERVAQPGASETSVRTGGAGEGSILLIAHVGAPGLPTVLAELPAVDQICLAVGPEGGWSDTEVAQLVASGGVPVGLGPTVLRTEHAAAAGIAVIAAATGRWG